MLDVHKAKAALGCERWQTLRAISNDALKQCPGGRFIAPEFPLPGRHAREPFGDFCFRLVRHGDEQFELLNAVFDLAHAFGQEARRSDLERMEMTQATLAACRVAPLVLLPPIYAEWQAATRDALGSISPEQRAAVERLVRDVLAMLVERAEGQPRG